MSPRELIRKRRALVSWSEWRYGTSCPEGVKLVDAAMLQLSYRKVKRMWLRYQPVGRRGRKQPPDGRPANTGKAEEPRGRGPDVSQKKRIQFGGERIL